MRLNNDLLTKDTHMADNISINMEKKPNSIYTNSTDNFDWEELLGQIKGGQVIPVIGNRLYLIEEGSGGVPLYDHLANELANEIKIKFPSNANLRFSKVAHEYMKINNLKDVKFKACLANIINSEKLVDSNPLVKLARIKSFNIFINTTYDDFLFKILSNVRSHPIKVLNYTKKEKKLAKLTDNDLEELKENRLTVIFNIFGSFDEKVVDPALTEKDILETLVDFQIDMKTIPISNFSIVLSDSSLLFLGCSYDDWFFRFFIRAIANKPFRPHNETDSPKFIGDSFLSNKKEDKIELGRFLKEFDVELYFSEQGKEFIDTLFKKMEEDSSEGIIQFSDFPATAFISFEGTNRPIARRLASHLEEDGIKVWLDDGDIRPGNEIDKTISEGIYRCPVFIPLISKESQHIHADYDKLRYHCREWEAASYQYNNHKNIGIKKYTIIPVIIDDTNWMYGPFKKFNYVKIPNGKRIGDYQKLKNELLKLQDPNYR